MDKAAQRRLQQNEAKKARQAAPPPPGMLKCATGPHNCPEAELFFCPVQDLGITDYSGPRGRDKPRARCPKHFRLQLEAMRRHQQTGKKRLNDNANKKARMDAEAPEGMARCRVGPHHVPLCDVFFCPVADLGMTYKGPLGKHIQRQYCRRHFAGYRINQNRHGRTERRKEQTRLGLIAWRKTAKYKTYQAQTHVRQKRRITSMHQQAKQRGIAYHLSPAVEAAIVADGAVCFHCGRQNARHIRGLYDANAEEDGFRPLGPGRVDTAGTYEDDNVVACCTMCNFARRTLPLDDFYEACANVAAFTDLGVPATAPITTNVGGALVQNASSFAAIAQGAATRNLCFELTQEEHGSLTSAPCYLCGAESRIGIDRFDSAVGYTLANCRSCCSTCNFLKSHFLHADFLDMCRAVAAKHAVPDADVECVPCDPED